MVTIYKYTFSVQDNFTIKMPDTSHILAAQLQREVPCIWAMVDTEQPLVERKFTIKGTGHPIEVTEKLNYIGTFQEMGGALVWHLFERTN